MGHHHDDVLRAGHQVHGAAHPLDHFSGDHPRGDIPCDVDLKGAKNRKIDVAAADHGERLGRIEDRRPGLRGDGLFAGVDHVGVESLLIGKLAHPQQAVLRLEHHFNAGGNVVGHQRRDTDPEVDVVAVAQLLGDAHRHLFAG